MLTYRVCREKGLTIRQALLYFQCIAYNPIYEKCMSELHDINAIYLIIELLTGERPGSGLLSLKYQDISIVEKDGLFAAHAHLIHDFKFFTFRLFYIIGTCYKINSNICLYTF